MASRRGNSSVNRTKTVAKVRDEGPEEIAARLGNVRPYRKQDGAYSFYIRLYDRRFRKIETRTVYPPEGCDRGRELESFLLMEIKKFEDEMEGGLEPRLSRMTFSDYFDGPFHDCTMAGRKAVHDYLRRQKRVASFRLGQYGEGDAGVTIVQLKK